ncbi:hypothetical protein [Kamptonema formosum]|uniref:hypothetical protein n=1 Tax=Kamptonema formosum TaxID=331992 RepID=UPI0012DD326C|nr:hypothetical protein [Oscillatoria sp. PCC 10802]
MAFTSVAEPAIAARLTARAGADTRSQGGAKKIRGVRESRLTKPTSATPPHRTDLELARSFRHWVGNPPPDPNPP